jgi:hypothetical protein
VHILNRQTSDSRSFKHENTAQANIFSNYVLHGYNFHLGHKVISAYRAIQRGHALDIVVPDTFIVYNDDGHNAELQ